MATVVSRAEPEEPRDRPLTIGAVCRRLQDEFPDISISKIRYLEDQGLLAPRRTQGGYRLFTEEDVDRLQTILRLQRDEFIDICSGNEIVGLAGGQNGGPDLLVAAETGEDGVELFLAQLF